MKRLLFAFAILCLLPSCDLVSREAGYPGGNLGYLADRNILFAKGHEQRLNRYFVALALMAPLMAETAQNPSDAKLTSERINELYRNMAKLHKAAQKCALPTKNISQDKLAAECQDLADGEPTALSFESLSFTVAKSMNDALKQSYDNLDIRANAERVLALDPTEILKTVLRARHLIPVLQEFLSGYRDVTIVFGQSIASSCERQYENLTKETKPKNVQQVACLAVTDKFTALLQTRTRTIDRDIAKNERPIRDVYKASEKALNAGLDWKLQSSHRLALLYHINKACNRLKNYAQVGDETYKGCHVDLANLGTDRPASHIKTLQEPLNISN